MKSTFNLTLAIAVTLTSSVFTIAKADEATINAKAYLGGKTIDASAWQAQSGHGTIGLLTDFNTGLQGLRLAVDLFGSGSEEDTTSNVKGTYTAEAQLGVRQYFSVQPKINLYVGGGINLAYATQTNNDGAGNSEEEDMDTGFWLNTGADYLLTEQINLGIDLRYASASVELYQQEVELNAFSTGVTLGYRW